MSETAKSFDQFRDVVRREDGHAVDVTTDLGSIVIDETEQIEFASVRNRGCRLSTRRASSVDQQAMTRVMLRTAIKPEARPCARVADEEQKHDRLQDADRSRHTRGKGQQYDA